MFWYCVSALTAASLAVAPLAVALLVGERRRLNVRLHTLETS